MSEEEKQNKKEVEEKGAKIVQVATETAPMVQLEDSTVVDSLELQVKIYNMIDELCQKI